MSGSIVYDRLESLRTGQFR